MRTMVVGKTTIQVEEPASWQHVHVVPGYSVSFMRVSQNIIVTTPAGISSQEAIERVYELRNRFIDEVLSVGASFIEVKDFRMIPGLPPAEARKRQVELYLADAGRCFGFVACCLSGVLGTMVKVGLLLKKSPYPYRVEADLQSALQEALRLEATIVRSLRVVEFSKKAIKPEWSLAVGSLRVQGWIIPPCLLGVTVEGWLTADAVDGIDEVLRNMHRAGELDHGQYYRVVDVSKVQGSDWNARAKFAANIRQLHQEYGPPRFSVVCGASVYVRASMLITFGFVRGLFRFAATEDLAIEYINQDILGATTLLSASEVESRHREMEPDLQRLMDDIGQLGWNGPEQHFEHVPDGHRLKPVYDALSLVQLDIKHLLVAREQDAESIAQAQMAMQSAKRARSELLSIANHEIRTPLNGLLGMLELLKQTPLSQDGLDYLETARRCGDDLMVLLSNLLDLSSIESGRMQLSPSYFSPALIVDELTEKYGPMARERGVQFIALESGPIDELLFADGRRLTQVLGILLQNASKVTASGDIVFEAKANKHQDRMDLEFSVKDTSAGIKLQDIPFVFAPFQESDLSFAKRFGGIGLGLSIVDQLVRMLGGTVHVESVPGKGSTFIVRFRFPVGS